MTEPESELEHAVGEVVDCHPVPTLAVDDLARDLAQRIGMALDAMECSTPDCALCRYNREKALTAFREGGTP